MAEPANPAKAPAVPPPAPAPAPTVAATPKVEHKESPFLKAVARMLTTTFFFAVGLALIGLAILLRKHPGLVPPAIQPVFDRFIPRLPYFVMSFGLLFLGQARSMVAKAYAEDQKKNRQYPHAWKIPLIYTQATILYVGFCYAFCVGLGWWTHPIKSLIGLLWLLLVVFAYVLWYLVSHFQHHFPSVAALRVALFLGLLPAGISFFCWTTQRMALISLAIGLFALIGALSSIGIAASKTVEQRGRWLQILVLLLTVGFLVPVGAKAMPFGEPRVDLNQLGLAIGGIDGQIGPMSYSNDGKKIAFAQKTGGSWFVQILTKDEDGKLSNTKVPAGDDLFHPIFVSGGKYIIADAVKDGGRGLWKINSETGSSVILRSGGVEPFGDGTPWSASKGQFLYVTQSGDGYALNSLTLAKGRSKTLFTSASPILTPSWGASGEDVCYADGVQPLFYVFNVKSKTKATFMSDYERVQEGVFSPQGKVDEAIPAPDGFRYLYVTHRDKTNAIWVVRTDGTHRDKLYETDNGLQNVAWHPDAQRIVFEEKFGKSKYLFFGQSSAVKVLDANLGSIQNLVPPQISHWSPAVSPDGVKIAFAASDGLWYPSFGQGVWVAVLR